MHLLLVEYVLLLLKVVDNLFLLQKWNILCTHVLTRNWVCFVTVSNSVVIYFLSLLLCRLRMYVFDSTLTKVTRLFAMGEFKHTYLNVLYISMYI